MQATSCYRIDGLPTFVESKNLNKSKRDDLTVSQNNQTSPLGSSLNLAIDFKNLNQTINKYDRLNELKKQQFKSDDESNNYKIDNDLKSNYLAYQNVYDVSLQNGHILLNKPEWFERLMNRSKINYDKNDKKDEIGIKDFINPQQNPNSLVCSGNLFTMFVIPDILHLSAYLFTIYLMRASEIEKTEHLLEKSFLQASQTNGWLIAHRRLVQKLRFFLYLAFSWLIVSVVNHLLHLLFQTIRFTILDQLTLIYHAPQLQAKLQTPLLVFTIITLIVKDLVCSVIIASYAIHCELNISFIQNLCRSLREKKIELQVC